MLITMNILPAINTGVIMEDLRNLYCASDISTLALIATRINPNAAWIRFAISATRARETSINVIALLQCCE